MRVALLGIGTAVPEHDIAQAQAADLAEAHCVDADARSRRVIGALYRRAGVERRGSVLADEHGVMAFYRPGEALPSTGERMGLYARHATNLGARACRVALERAGTGAGSITHLVTVSCTGFAAPGVDLELIERLGLGPETRRTHIGFMGCHAAVNAIAVARAFAMADPGARVLVCCVELCSLHFDHDADAQGHVANALFADGAGAVVVGASDNGGVEIASVASVVLPDSKGMMSWHIGDRGFRMRLSPSVPAVLAACVPAWLDAWLMRDVGIGVAGVGSWAVHPGGPRVLSALGGALGLSDEAIEDSRAVLADHGNMSSPTLLFIIERLLGGDCPLPLVAMAFGPGLGGEALLLTR